jgi:hypothetical protein
MIEESKERIAKSSAKTIDAMAELIQETLQGDDPTRFATAAALCRLGHEVMRTQAVRVEDFAQLDRDGPMAHHNTMMMPNPRGGLGVNFGFGGDGMAAQREQQLALLPLLQITSETSRAQGATSEATELATLIEVRKSYRPGSTHHNRLEKRIEILFTHIEARSHESARLDATDVSRGHQIGEGGDGRDDGPNLPPHPDRREGNHGPAFEIVEPFVGQVAVGEGI